MRKHHYLTIGLLSIVLFTLYKPAFAQNILPMKHEMRDGVSLYDINKKQAVANYNTYASQADYNEKAQTLCALDYYNGQVWMAQNAQQKRAIVHTLKKDDIYMPEGGGMRVDNQGRCLVSLDRRNNQLILASLNTPVKIITLQAPTQSSQNFPEDDPVQSILYHPDAGFLIVSKYSYAVVPAGENDVPETLTRIEPKGRVQGTQLRLMKEKGTLSPDGKILYTYAEIADENYSAFEALIALDIESGNFQRIYLPAMENGYNEDTFHFDQHYIVADGAVGLSSDGKTLYANAYKERRSVDEDRTFLLVAIHVETGAVEPVTLPQELMDSEFMGLQQSTGNLIFQQGGYDERKTVFFDANKQQVVYTIDASMY